MSGVVGLLCSLGVGLGSGSVVWSAATVTPPERRDAGEQTAQTFRRQLADSLCHQIEAELELLGVYETVTDCRDRELEVVWPSGCKLRENEIVDVMWWCSATQSRR